jgi:hypothetical protein
VRRVACALMGVLLLAFSVRVEADPPGAPWAEYVFANVSGGVVQNESAGIGPDITMRGSDYAVEADGSMAINLNNTAFFNANPPVLSNGTYGDTPAFDNDFNSGTIGIRLKADDHTDNEAGNIWAAILTWIEVPDDNDISWQPLMLDFKRDSAIDNLTAILRWGPHEYCAPGCMYMESEQVRSGQFAFEPDGQFFNIIATWSPTKLLITIDDGTPVTLDPRVYGNNWPTDQFTMYLGLNNSHIHPGEYQYFGGWLKRLVIYDSALNSTDITALNTALSEDVEAPAGGHHPRMLRRLRVR